MERTDTRGSPVVAKSNYDDVTVQAAACTRHHHRFFSGLSSSDEHEWFLDNNDVRLTEAGEGR